MELDLSLEQYAPLFSVFITALSIVITVIIAFINHRSSMRRLIKEKQIDCYSQTVYILLKIQRKGLNEERLDSFAFFSSYVQVIGSDNAITQVSECLDKIRNKTLSPDDIVKTINVLKKEIRKLSVLSTF